MTCNLASRYFGGIFDIEGKTRRIDELEHRAADPELWQNADAATKLQQNLAQLKQVVGTVTELEKTVEDCLELLDLAEEDDEIASELDESVDGAQKRIEGLELQRMLSGQFDAKDAILTINSGAGGTESQDWTQMLHRMLLRWCERKGFRTESLDIQHGDEAGLKSATFGVQGLYAYGHLRAEQGVHRLVRISPFDANKRRHTSFASVAVTPEIDDDIEIEIREEDLRVDTYRASGAGGQHVNKTDSAVRLTHQPSGVVVACQAERSQHKNRAKAMKMLRSKLFEIELRRMEEEKAELAGEKKSIEWGSQIRSYVLQPYRLVKDHRTGFENSNTDAVLDGDIDGFIEAFLLGKESTEEGSEP